MIKVMRFNISGKYIKIISISTIIVLLTTAYIFYIHKRSQKLQRQQIMNSIANQDFDIVFGSDSAPVTIYLYFRYNCVFCRSFFQNGYDSLQKEYIGPGKVKLVLKLLELTNDEAVLNSLKTIVCINEFGNMQSLHELLLTQPEVVYSHEFIELTQDFINKDDFVAECMLDGGAENYLLANIIEFNNLNLTGTPTFIINGNIYKGFKSYSILKKAIEKEI